MKIAMLQDSWWPQVGGGPVHVKELSIALAEEYDCEIDIYTRALLDESEEEYSDDETIVHGVNVVRKGQPKKFHDTRGRLRSAIPPVRDLRQRNYDIIHGHTYLPGLPTRLGQLMTGIPSVFTVHGTSLPSGVGLDQSYARSMKEFIEHIVLFRLNYDEVISVNREHIDLLSNYHDSVKFVPNGVDVDRFDVEGFPNEEYLLFLGRLAPKKRPQDLLRAFKLIHDEFPNLNVKVVGEGPLSSELEQLASDLGVESDVEFLGFVPDEDLPSLYAGARCFVLPSIWEGHPLTLMEAWAAGAPVIASRTEGIQEFVDHGETAHLAHPKDPEKLADALRKLLQNPEYSEHLSKTGRGNVRENYTWRQTAKKTMDVYFDTI